MLFDAGDAVFDASQYAFFGNDNVEEVELGGLEDEDEDLPAVGFDDGEYRLDPDEVTFYEHSRVLCMLNTSSISLCSNNKYFMFILSLFPHIFCHYLFY